MPTWDAKQYLRFNDQRTRPCRELAARIEVASPDRVIDLGCGPGNSTGVLAERWPKAELTGLDSSPEMIAAAIVEWYKGTGLRPFLDALADDQLKAGFTAQYLECIQQAYPVRKDGHVIFPFRRLFLIAYQQP